MPVLQENPSTYKPLSSGFYKGLIFIALVLLGIAIAAQVCVNYSGGDREWLLFATRQWLGGKRLYVDLLETNPPLIFWIYSIPVWIERYFNLPPTSHVLAVMGLCAVAGSVYLCRRLIALHPVFADNARKQAEFTILLCFTLIYNVHTDFFFDREHIFVVLTFPYLLRWMPSLSRQSLPLPLRIAIGCMAGIGFCMKPHCLAIFAGVQLLYLIRERSLRILISYENCAIYAAQAIYLIAVFHFAPDYVFLVWPMLMATFRACNNREFFWIFSPRPLVTFILTFTAFRLRYTSPYRKDILYFSLLSLCFVVYILANNGWSYTYMPLIVFLLFINGWMLWELDYLKKTYASAKEAVKLFDRGISACIICIIMNVSLMLLFDVPVLLSRCDYVCTQNKVFADILTQQHARSFDNISEDFAQWPVLSRTTGTEWQAHFHFLWMMPAFITQGPNFQRQHQDILDYVSSHLADDLNTKKPDIVFVHHMYGCSFEPGWNKTSLDYADYFSVYPSFREAWTHYKFVESTKGQDGRKSCKWRYDIYRRDN